MSYYVDETLYDLSGFSLNEIAYVEMSTLLPYDIGAFVAKNIWLSYRVDTILTRSFKGPEIQDDPWSMAYIKPKLDPYYYLR